MKRGDSMLQFKWDNFDFTLLQFGKGVFQKDMAGHSHSKNSYELHYILDGEGWLNTAEDRYFLEKGVFFVTGPKVYHQQVTSREKPMTEIYVYIQAAEKKTNQALVSTFLSTHFHFQKNCSFEWLFLEILKEEEEKKWGYRSNVAAYMQLLLTEVTRAYWPDHREIAVSNDNLNDRRFILIENAFIEKPAEITLRSLSEQIGLCERQTQRLLKKYYGKTFLEKKAESLNDSIKDVKKL